jgi:transcriptional regulator with XRE-family HTH domain
MSAAESVSEDWAAVAAAINERLSGLGWRQRDLAERSGVSLATVREIQRHSAERRRSPRTLESLSSALGWPPGHLSAVLRGQAPAEPTDRGRDNALSRWTGWSAGWTTSARALTPCAPTWRR